jgi:hypothetical protein
MEEKKKQTRSILPDRGWWDVESLAQYLNLNPSAVMQKLSDLGVKTLSFSRLYKHKLFKLEDLGKDQKGL